MKIGLAQINTTVGDFDGNRRTILEAYKKLCAKGAELVLYPELAVCGYPPRDLLFQPHFVTDNEAVLHSIANGIGVTPAIIGCATSHRAAARGHPLANAAAWCENGQVRHIARKCLLPTYDVFDETRYFEPAAEPTVLSYKGRRIGLSLCEDIWTDPSIPTHRIYPHDPIEKLAAAAPDLILNLSASPWHRGKETIRRAVIASAARRCQCPIVYCNLIGGNDDLIFDGGSCAIAPDGRFYGILAPFTEDCRVLDLSMPPTATGSAAAVPNELDALRNALVLGLRDYAHKSGFTQAIIGLSGGIDSALTAVLATEALGQANVTGVSLPSLLSSPHSRHDAEALAHHLGITYKVLPIQSTVSAASEALKPFFENLPEDVTEENLQARIRGLLLMALSNKFRALLLATGNKSELAVGYCTLYGDMCGGLAVLSDLSKTLVYALARRLNQAYAPRPLIPLSTLNKPPSAELRPNQRDDDTLPPYDILDEILHRYLENRESALDIINATGFSETLVRDILCKVDANEYKRKQAPPGLKTTPVAFGAGRRVPIVQRYNF